MNTLDQNNQPNLTPESPKPNWFLNHKVLYSVIGVLLLTVIVGSAYWWQMEKQTSNNLQQTNQTETWKTYTNREYGFAFKYPNNYTAKEYTDNVDAEQSDRGVKLTSGDLNLVLSINNTIYVGGAPTKSISKEQKTLGQISATKSIVFGYQILPNGTWVLSYSFKNLKDNYNFSTSKDGVEGVDSIPKTTENLMEQILSTFKFTDSISTTTWKTYFNSQYGFEFQYPATWTKRENPNGVTLTMFGPGVHNPDDGVFNDGARIVFTGANSLTDQIKDNTTNWKGALRSFSEYNFIGSVIYDSKKPEPDWGSWIKAYSVSNNGKVVQLDWLSSNSLESTNFNYQNDLLPILATLKFK